VACSSESGVPISAQKIKPMPMMRGISTLPVSKLTMKLKLGERLPGRLSRPGLVLERKPTLPIQFTPTACVKAITSNASINPLTSTPPTIARY
jgi:hypothetical protein